MKYKALIIIFLFIYNLNVIAEQTEIKFGSVAQDIPSVMHRRLLPLTTYLSYMLNRPVSLKLSSDMTRAINEVATGAVDLAYLTPVAYTQAHDDGGSQIVAKMITKGKASFQLMIVVKENSPIKTVKDLVGKSFAFGDPAALLQRATVAGAGIPLQKLGKYEFIGHYDNIARGVVRGIFDAGILKDSKAFKWETKGLRIIYRSAHLPPYNITASHKVSPELLKKIKQAFLKLDVSNTEDKLIIKSMGKKYDGFVATSDSEYDVVRNLIQPFRK